MGYYRKRPVVIEAVRFLKNDDANRPVFDGPEPDWLQMALGRREIVPRPEGLLIKTKEGAMTASNRDWIIRGVQGELYPCKPSIFDATYEPADEE